MASENKEGLYASLTVTNIDNNQNILGNAHFTCSIKLTDLTLNETSIVAEYKTDYITYNIEIPREKFKKILESL